MNLELQKAPESFYLKDILAADEEAISKGIINEIDSCTLMAHHGAKMHVVNGELRKHQNYDTGRFLYI